MDVTEQAVSPGLETLDRIRWDLWMAATVVGLVWPERTEAAEIPADVRALFDERQTARADKDWANADRLRDEIAARGFVIEDGPDGSRLVPSA